MITWTIKYKYVILEIPWKLSANEETIFVQGSIAINI